MEPKKYYVLLNVFYTQCFKAEKKTKKHKSDIKNEMQSTITINIFRGLEVCLFASFIAHKLYTVFLKQCLWVRLVHGHSRECLHCVDVDSGSLL